MSENHKVDLFLTSAQKSKYIKKLPFQMTAKQCMSKEGKHHLCVNLDKKKYNEFLKKVSKNKGMRFSKDVFQEGSGLLKDMMKGVAKGVAPILIDKIGDKTGTRGITDSLLKPNSDKLIDKAIGSGFELDQMRPAVMPRKRLPRSNEIKFAVMPEINGQSVKKKRLIKGSEEAKAFMASIRQKKGKGVKCDGSGVFEDFGRKIKDTFNPNLGRKIKDALTSNTAKKVYKGLADIAIPIIATASGQPMLGQVAKIGVDSVLGGTLQKKRKTTNIKSNTSTLINGVPQLLGGLHLLTCLCLILYLLFFFFYVMIHLTLHQRQFSLLGQA